MSDFWLYALLSAPLTLWFLFSCIFEKESKIKSLVNAAVFFVVLTALHAGCNHIMPVTDGPPECESLPEIYGC